MKAAAIDTAAHTFDEQYRCSSAILLAFPYGDRSAVALIPAAFFRREKGVGRGREGESRARTQAHMYLRWSRARN